MEDVRKSISDARERIQKANETVALAQQEEAKRAELEASVHSKDLNKPENGGEEKEPEKTCQFYRTFGTLPNRFQEPCKSFVVNLYYYYYY